MQILSHEGISSFLFFGIMCSKFKLFTSLLCKNCMWLVQISYKSITYPFLVVVDVILGACLALSFFGEKILSNLIQPFTDNCPQQRVPVFVNIIKKICGVVNWVNCCIRHDSSFVRKIDKHVCCHDTTWICFFVKIGFLLLS